MTQPEKSYCVEGELVRDAEAYEYDDLEIDGRDLKELVEKHLGPGREELEGDGRHHWKTRYGRVRLTIEVLG